ncbi:MAG TPA: universal stress protein [Acidobacteriota bacterium]
MFKRILIATDFSRASRAALYAGLGVARKCLANVLAVHCATPLEILLESPQPAPLQGAQLQKILGRQFEDFFPESLYANSTKKILVGRSPAEEIVKAARAGQCDLIVVGSHGHGGVGRTLIGSVAQRVTRDSEIPVMVVRDVEHSHKKYEGYRRILVPTDFSETSMKALDLGVRFSNFLQADLHLIHVVDWPTITLISTVYPGYPFFQVKDPEPDKLRMEKTLDELLLKKELVGKSTTATLIGDPADEILRYAEKENIDFIVMGTHGRKGLERVLMGSTTSAVMAKSEIPVLTISVPV